MEKNDSIEPQLDSKRARIEVNWANPPTDPYLRKKNSDYHPSDRDNIRRAYLQKKPWQPFDHNFPQTQFEKTSRRFNKVWFKEYSDWLEYNILKDAAYYLYCYLFRQETEKSSKRRLICYWRV